MTELGQAGVKLRRCRRVGLLLALVHHTTTNRTQWFVADCDGTERGCVLTSLLVCLPQSFAQKFQLAAQKASSQAQSFGKVVAAEVQQQSQKTITGFKLENEVLQLIPHIHPSSCE